MNRQIQKLLSQALNGDREKPEVSIRKSYPLFCASASDGVVLAALNPLGMPARIDAILDRIAYGGIGRDADIDTIVREVAVPAIWKAEVEVSHEDVLADHLAHDAKKLIADGHKDSLLADPLETELVFVQLGFQQDEDRIVVVDVRGNQYNKSGWAILPERLPKTTASWQESFVYDPECNMVQLFVKFEKLGKIWRTARSKSRENLVWEIAHLRRKMAVQKRWYEVFQRQSLKIMKGVL